MEKFDEEFERVQNQFDRWQNLFWRVFPWFFGFVILGILAQIAFYVYVAYQATPSLLRILEKFAS